jgi:8-oxo-dGTP diphosphatase
MSDVEIMVRCSAILWGRHDGSILLVRRERHGRTEYALPGGTPRTGESLVSCARREVLEETGLRVQPARCAFVLETGEGTAARTIDIVFTVPWKEPHEDRPVGGSEAHLEAVYVPVDDLPGLTLLPPIAGHIRGMARSRRHDTIPVLGNLWRPVGETDDEPSVVY